MDDNVTVPEQAVIETPVETTTTPPADGETETGGTTTADAGVDSSSELARIKAEAENLKQALKQERDRYKQTQRELAQTRGNRQLEQYSQEDLDQVYSNPLFQEQAVKIAEYEIKEGINDILSRYPNFPKQIASAIRRNPRGYVQPTTQDVPNALLDIEDYIASVAEEFNQPEPPKNVRIADTNADVQNKGTSDVEIAEILSIPPEDWTPEQEAVIRKHTAVSKNR